MAFPLLPVLIGVTLLSAASRSKQQRPKTAHGVMTDRMQVIYMTALQDVKDPKMLMRTADEFEQRGCYPQAEMLRKRARLRMLPPEEKKRRDEITRKALNSQNKDAVMRLAKWMHHEGATGAARALFRHADGLPDVQQVAH